VVNYSHKASSTGCRLPDLVPFINSSKSGAIRVLNGAEDTSKGLWVDSSPTGYSSWANKTLVNISTGATAQVNADGRGGVEASARGYAVYVLQEEYEPVAEVAQRAELAAF